MSKRAVNLLLANMTTSNPSRTSFLVLLINVGFLVVVAVETSSSLHPILRPDTIRRSQSHRHHHHQQQQHQVTSLADDNNHVSTIGRKFRNRAFRDRRMGDAGTELLTGTVGEPLYTSRAVEEGMVNKSGKDGTTTNRSGKDGKSSKVSKSESAKVSKSEKSPTMEDSFDQDHLDENDIPPTAEEDEESDAEDGDHADNSDDGEHEVHPGAADSEAGSVDATDYEADNADAADNTDADAEKDADDDPDDAYVDSFHPTTSPTSRDDVSGSVRTVQLSHPADSSGCMAYIDDLDVGAVRMVDCSFPGSGDDGSVLPPIDHWEVLDVSEDLFNLRHKSSQLCIPQNPENPDQSFDCFRNSGNGVAIADSINGLVNCSSEFAALIGLQSNTSTVFMYNTGCLNPSEPGHDFIAMSYKTNDAADSNPTIVVWGERIIMDLPGMVEEFNFQSEWMLLDV